VRVFTDLSEVKMFGLATREILVKDDLAAE